REQRRKTFFGEPLSQTRPRGPTDYRVTCQLNFRRAGSPVCVAESIGNAWRKPNPIRRVVAPYAGRARVPALHRRYFLEYSRTYRGTSRDASRRGSFSGSCATVSKGSTPAQVENE